MDGEPDVPVTAEFVFSPSRVLWRNDSFNYSMLDRLKMDCEYYLGYGNRNAKHLWASTEAEHIAYMKKLWNGFPADAKPEWLTFEQIEEYERQMLAPKV
jgi:hypothetical protein